eukprot:318112_1
MPFFIFVYKNVKLKLTKNYQQIKIDSEYAMITTKLELILLFGVISPFVIPLVMFTLKLNYIFYSIMIYKYKWKINFRYNYLSISFLFFSLFIQHLFSFGFIYYSIDENIYTPQNNYFHRFVSCAFVVLICLLHAFINIKRYLFC